MATEHVECVQTSKKNLKRKREKSVLDHFTQFTNDKEKIRVKSGLELLKYLIENEDEKIERELKYALGRLIRGLGSSEIKAKAGFFATFVCLLNLKNITIDEIFTCVSKELCKAGSNSKSENADICSGQILVSGAILHSNLYENCSDGDKNKVLEMLLNAGKERAYLCLASYKFLIDLFLKISLEEFKQVIFPLIKEELTKPWAELNLDSFYLLVEAHRSFPDFIDAKFLKNNLGTREILCVDSLSDVCDILITIPRVTALKHPIYEIFIKTISQSELIVPFFEKLDLTLTKPNRNKYLVFSQLLSGVLENLQDSTIIPNILTNTFIQQTISTFKNAVGKMKDEAFQQSSKKLFEALINSLKKENVKYKVKIRVLKRLLFYPGTFIFEKVSRSKLIQNIIATLNTEGVKKMGDIYCDVILATKDRTINENMTERWWNSDRIYASHLLVKLLNHPSMQDNNQWKIEQLTLLLRLGLLNNESDNISHELSDSLKETFYSALDLKLGKLEDLRMILSKLVYNLNEIVTENNLDTILRHPLSRENYEIWKETVKLAVKLENNTKKKYAVFHTLFLHLGLQLFNNSKLASDSLKELFSCYERIKKSKKSIGGEANSDDPLWIEVVTDLFLNLLSHNSHLLRSVINHVFPHLCNYMNETAVHQILSVLDPKNESNPLSKDDDESDEDENNEQNEASSECSKSDDDDDEDEDDDGDDNDDEVVSDQFRMTLHQALGFGAESDAESIDLDDLNDEEGEKLDEALSQAFKQFRPNLGKNKKQNKDDLTLMHFRIRVLDLIDIYLNSNPSMLLTLEIMLPLLQLLEFSIKDDHQKPLQDRVRACLKKLASLKKFSSCEDVTEKKLVNLLKSLLEKGTKNAIVIKDMGEKIAECCILIITCSEIIKNQEQTSRKHKHSVSNVIKDNLDAFFKNRDCLVPYVLFKNIVLLNWNGILDLIPNLLTFIFTNVIRPFRRNQAMELLKLFFNNHRFINAHKEEIKILEESIRHFLLDCIGFFTELKNNLSENKIKEKFIHNLFELLNEIKISQITDQFECWDAIGTSIRECRSNLSFSKSTKIAFNKLCRSLNISNIVQINENLIKLDNNNVSKCNDENETKPPKKKKRHPSKCELKLKKETKDLRLQSLSEGLGKRKVQWSNIEETNNKKIKN